MIKKTVGIAILVILFLFITGCEAITGAMPSAQATDTPVKTETASPTPTWGELKTLDSAYCMESDPEAHETEFFVLRFFPSGVVLQVTVKGQTTWEETWDYIEPYLKDTATDTFSHGEYIYSEGRIEFTLAPAGSDEVSGTVTGRIEGEELILDQQGTEMVYYLVYYGGK